MPIVDQKHGRGKGFSSVPTLDFALLDGEKDRFLRATTHYGKRRFSVSCESANRQGTRRVGRRLPGRPPNAHIIKLFIGAM